MRMAKEFQILLIRESRARAGSEGHLHALLEMLKRDRNQITGEGGER